MRTRQPHMRPLDRCGQASKPEYSDPRHFPSWGQLLPVSVWFALAWVYRHLRFPLLHGVYRHLCSPLLRSSLKIQTQGLDTQSEPCDYGYNWIPYSCSNPSPPHNPSVVLSNVLIILRPNTSKQRAIYSDCSSALPILLYVTPCKLSIT